MVLLLEVDPMHVLDYWLVSGHLEKIPMIDELRIIDVFSKISISSLARLISFAARFQTDRCVVSALSTSATGSHPPLCPIEVLRTHIFPGFQGEALP